MSQILPVVHILSKVLMLFAFAFLLPLGVSTALDDGAQFAYKQAILTAFSPGRGSGCCRAAASASCKRATASCWWR